MMNCGVQKSDFSDGNINLNIKLTYCLFSLIASKDKVPIIRWFVCSHTLKASLQNTSDYSSRTIL